MNLATKTAHLTLWLASATLLAAGALLMHACRHTPAGASGRDEERTQMTQKPKSRGLPYELVLVIPRGLYTGELKDTLDAVLMGSTPVLPQHEPMFRLDVAFTDANLTPWRTFRNRLVVDVETGQGSAQMGVALDAVARPQIEVKLTAATAHELAEFIGAQRQRLTDLIVDHELECEAASLRRTFSRMTADSLQRWGHTVCVPAGLRAAKVGRDFLWTGTNLNDKDQNFVYYSYPWDGRPLTTERFVAAHDSVLRANIPGARAGQWMQTARVRVGKTSSEKAGNSGGQPLVLARTRVINKKVVQQVHGLWELRAGALGGPFVALERVDTAACRVVVCEGFVYSPHSPKRDLLRQMEAALRTFE